MLFSLEGVVGCGKSTTLSLLKERGFSVIHEPVEAYSNFQNGKYNPLECAYASPKTDSPLAQMHIMKCAESHYPSNCNKQSRVGSFEFSERCFFSSEIFINAYHQVGNLSAFSRAYLLDCHKSMCTSKTRPDAFVFLDLDPEICCDRVVKRGAKFESKLTLEFQLVLRQAHLQFFREREKTEKSASFIRIEIDSSDTPDEVADRVLKECEMV